MIRVYLIRHGLAEADGSLPAEARPLSSKGRRRVRRTASAFSRLCEDVDHYFTSPYVRAAQTAEIVAAATGHDELRVLDELRPEASPASIGRLLKTLGKLVGDGEGVVLVGHEPQLSRLAARLAGVPALALRFPKGRSRVSTSRACTTRRAPSHAGG